MKFLVCKEFQRHDFHVELAVIVVIVALLVLGLLVPTGHTVLQEIAALNRPPRLYLPYTKEDAERSEGFASRRCGHPLLMSTWYSVPVGKSSGC